MMRPTVPAFLGTIPLGEAGAALKIEIEARITAGDWPAGFRLPGERGLATQFGVSRAVVREVLQTLAAQGRVQISPARGAFVRRPDGSALSGVLSLVLSTQGATVRDVAEARSLLETEITVRAAANRGGGVIEWLAVIAKDVDSGEDRVSQAIGDLKFHSLLCSAAGNPALTAMHRAIAPYVLLMTLRREREHASAGAMHSQLVEVIRAGNVAEARTLCEAHLQVTQQHFGTDFDRPVEEVAAENLQRISSGLWSLEDVERRAFMELDTLFNETEREQ